VALHGEPCDDAISCEDIPPVPFVIIPSLSQWGMIFMFLVMGVIAVFYLRRRQEV